MNEIWKPIRNYEDLYKISNLGNVKSLRTNKILKFGEVQGYLNVSLCKNGKSVSKRVHRLVAEAFLSKKKNQNIVNHIDGNKQNNNVNNLEWCTQKDNIQHSWKNGFSKSNEKQKQAVKIANKKINRYGREIFQYNLNGKFVKKWCNAREIKRQLGISLTTLFMACTGRQKSACGYIWKYGENPKKIIQYNLNGEIIKTWKRVQDIEKECKVDKTSIYKCCTGKQKTAKGFIWRYAV